jgi:hypothetical protein
MRLQVLTAASIKTVFCNVVQLNNCPDDEGSKQL